MRILDYHCREGWTELPQPVMPPLVPFRNGDRLEFNDYRVSRRNLQGELLWELTLPALPRRLHRSGSRALLLTRTEEYHAWGYLGPALLLDLEQGQILAELRGERALVLPEQRFLLGLEGYDAFDTWLYDDQGRQVQHWRSYGHYTADPDGSVRVCECDRSSPSNSRVVRLLMDGTIERGDLLRCGQIPTPVELPNGLLILFEERRLRTLDRQLVLRDALDLVPFLTWSQTANAGLWMEDQRLTVCVIQRKMQPHEFASHLWTIEV